MMDINGIGSIILLSLHMVTGFGILAVYAKCDPVSLGILEKKDQMFPYYVVDKLRFLAGVPGIFVATLISATLR